MVKTQTPITFGKYKGQCWELFVNIDPEYIVWAYCNIKGPYMNCPRKVAKAAAKVIRMRSHVDGYWGTRPYRNWHHPDYWL